MADFSEEIKSTILNLPGRQLIPFGILASMIDQKVGKPLNTYLRKLFGEDWEEQLGNDSIFLYFLLQKSTF